MYAYPSNRNFQYTTTIAIYTTATDITQTSETFFCVCVCAHLCTCACTYVFVHVCGVVFVYICVGVSVCVHMCSCRYTCIYACAHECR